MKVMKYILISFIVINLAFQGFLSSVFAANTAGEVEGLNITLKIHDLLKQSRSAEFILKVKPLTINEQVLLKTIEAKTQSLQDQAAGDFYDNSFENSRGQPPFINSPVASHIINGAILGAFIGWLTSTGKDIAAVRRSTQKGALGGAVFVSILFLF